MKNVALSLLIGITAGVIDVIPMLLQNINKYACVSAFIQWVVLGLIIPYINWNMQPWIKGLIVAELLAFPVMVLVLEKEPKSIIPIAIFSAVLGALVGIAGFRLIK
jgi:hypothetical protein